MQSKEFDQLLQGPVVDAETDLSQMDCDRFLHSSGSRPFVVSCETACLDGAGSVTAGKNEGQ